MSISIFCGTFRCHPESAVCVDSQTIPAVINNPPQLLCCQVFYIPDLSIVGVDVVELHLKRRVLLDEDNGLDVSVLKGFVVADVELSRYDEGSLRLEAFSFRWCRW